MGLDVYLKKWEDIKGWEKCNNYEDNEECLNFTYIEQPSSKYPDHLFRVGYFRSSYNESGINYKLRNIIGLDLYSIFNPPPLDKSYHFQPDWELAKSIAQKTLRDLKDYINKGSYGILKIDENPLVYRNNNAVTSEALALQKFQEILKKHCDSPFGNFTSANGHFFLSQPLKVLGVLHGRMEDVLGVTRNCQYIIYEDDNLEWYVQCLEIVEETCDWVLSQPERDRYCLAWTG